MPQTSACARIVWKIADKQWARASLPLEYNIVIKQPLLTMLNPIKILNTKSHLPDFSNLFILSARNWEHGLKELRVNRVNRARARVREFFFLMLVRSYVTNERHVPDHEHEEAPYRKNFNLSCYHQSLDLI